MNFDLTLYAKNKHSFYQMEVCTYVYVQIHKNGYEHNMRLESNFEVYATTKEIPFEHKYVIYQ